MLLSSLEKRRPGVKRLVAAYLVAEREGGPTADELRAFLPGETARIYGASSFCDTRGIAVDFQWEGGPPRFTET